MIKFLMKLLGLFSSAKKEPKTLQIEEKPKMAKKEEKTSLTDVKAYEEENKVALEEKKAPKPVPDVDFKTERCREEYATLESKNRDLRDLIEDVNQQAFKRFGKSVLITMIYRTQEEQDYLYADNAKYQKKKFKSPHQFWHAVDLRSRTFTEREISQLVDFINVTYNDKNYYKFTAMCHTVGHGMHFHIQFVKA